MEIERQLLAQSGITGLGFLIIVFIATVFYVIKSVYELRNLQLNNKVLKLELGE